VLVKAGKALLEEVPAPKVTPGVALIRTAASCISVGTEMSGVRSSGQPLWKRALKQPDKVRKVIALAKDQGVGRALSMVESKLGAGQPTGYSAAGTVIAVGAGIDDLAPGDRVACAGAQCAFHAEVLAVPRNLIVPLADELEFTPASSVALGAIALQGVRRAQPTLGETFVVLGLGILGQLTAQLLRRNGCRVIGTDLDRGRIELALKLGLDHGAHPEDGPERDQIARLTDGLGADGVIITAASPSDAVVATAFGLCRKKGRVVLVGDVGLHLNRADFYEKELDFLISTSYGPGRYDHNYEEGNLDYPAPWVRWTENRNMSEYLRLLAGGQIDIEPLISKVYGLEEAPSAYEALAAGGGGSTMMVFLSYPAPRGTEAEPARRTVVNPHLRSAGSGKLHLALVGAGGFAHATALPNLRKLGSRYELRTIVDGAGHRAVAAARQFGAAEASSDFDAVLEDARVDTVYITTRHDSHAAMTLRALRAGKHVMVEKPLALSEAELRQIEEFYEAANGGAPVLMTGFNRRFSPCAKRLRELASRRSAPMILNYRMNAGHIPLDHWVHGPEGGGRNIGEACHIYDLFTFLTGARVKRVQAMPIEPRTAHYGRSDNFVATILFDDGSLATLTYTALGFTSYPKEMMEAYVDGKVVVLSDYRTLTVHGARDRGIKGTSVDKGHERELVELADGVRRGEWPIPLWQQLQAMRIAFDVERALTPVARLDDAAAAAAPAARPAMR
jgi:predicted dehydrogenase/threonine dehydrogenase-like Zn-dependent dehydrogenase